MAASAGSSGESGPRFRGTDKVSQRFLRSASQLRSKQKRDQTTPPPGREVEVSIEPDESAAFFGLRECHALVVDDAERHVNAKVDPP